MSHAEPAKTADQVVSSKASVDLPDVSAAPLVDLSRYDQSWFNRGRSGWIVLLWWLVQAIAFPLTPHPSSGVRIALLRLFGAQIGHHVIIRPTARFTFPWKVKIGDYSWIGDDVVFYSLEQIHIGQHSIISQKCYLCTGSHDIHDPAFNLKVAPITIGNGVWIATDCFLGPGVHIGSNAVIGARSSVFSSMPDQQVCWGSPCRPRYQRTVRSPETQ
ncbi:MAG: hormogonium polysaccharide biosynthesis acetyltransferase HpsU [Elainellaceae cyanobacterium]